MKWLRNCCWLKKWFHSKCLKTEKDLIWRKSNGKEFHNWQADTLKDLPPSVLRLYLGQTKLKLEYLVLRACRSLLNFSKLWLPPITRYFEFSLLWVSEWVSECVVFVVIGVTIYFEYSLLWVSAWACCVCPLTEHVHLHLRQQLVSCH